VILGGFAEPRQQRVQLLALVGAQGGEEGVLGVRNARSAWVRRRRPAEAMETTCRRRSPVSRSRLISRSASSGLSRLTSTLWSMPISSASSRWPRGPRSASRSRMRSCRGLRARRLPLHPLRQNARAAEGRVQDRPWSPSPPRRRGQLQGQAARPRQAGDALRGLPPAGAEEEDEVDARGVEGRDHGAGPSTPGRRLTGIGARTTWLDQPTTATL
jgi:hypothetical protein